MMLIADDSSYEYLPYSCNIRAAFLLPLPGAKALTGPVISGFGARSSLSFASSVEVHVYRPPGRYRLEVIAGPSSWNHSVYSRFVTSLFVV